MLGIGRRAGVTLLVGGLLLVPIFVGAGVISLNSSLAGGAPSPSVGPGDAGTLALGAPHFVDEAEAAGVTHRYDGESEFVVGGGVAVFDCDDDTLPDLYLAGGSQPAALYRNASDAGGDLRFSPLSDATTDLDAVTGAYPLDVDSDGIADLAVLRRGENVLLRGRGRCRFERANETWSFDGGSGWTTAFSAAWHGDGSWPTLAAGNYLDVASDDNTRQCGDNELFRPADAGAGFAPALALSPGWCSLSMLFSDWDRSGRRDLRISNDRHYYSDHGDGQEQLWRVAGEGLPDPYTEAEGWQPLRIWGMGIASHDVNGDGYPEYYLTSQGDNKLQALADGPARPSFRDIALRMGVTAHRPYTGGESLPSTAWHAEFDDVNNDGLMDLYVAKGNVEAQPGHATRDPSNLLLRQVDGSFVEAAEAAGIVDFARGRGAAVVDLNADGLLDLVEVKRRENVRLRRNVGAGTAADPAPMGNWLDVRLWQDGPNPDAVGAWIEVRSGGRTTIREVTIGGGHAGGQLGPTHFGLGAAVAAAVRVTWPDGSVGAWQEIDANQRVEVDR
jgi:hypothetical protein